MFNESLEISKNIGDKEGIAAFSSNFCNEVYLFPKRGLLKSIDAILLLSL